MEQNRQANLLLFSAWMFCPWHSSYDASIVQFTGKSEQIIYAQNIVIQRLALFTVTYGFNKRKKTHRLSVIWETHDICCNTLLQKQAEWRFQQKCVTFRHDNGSHHCDQLCKDSKVSLNLSHNPKQIPRTGCEWKELYGLLAAGVTLGT